MRKLRNTAALLLLMLIGVLVSCNKNNGINVPLQSEVNEFIWQGMRTYYYWQAEVPDLAENRFTTFDELHAFLNEYNSPESLFEHFKYQDDRFSIIVDDYEVLDDFFQGISKSFGYEFRLVRIGETEFVFGYVQYVLEGSPAADAGLKRGDLFHSVNGTILTDSNFQELLLETESHTLSFGDFISREAGLSDNGRSLSMTAVELTENPVFMTKTFDVDGVKVGYLVYNQFTNTFNSELNAAFGQLKAEGVTEMVLDLRYNPGGSISSAQTLASMLYDDAGTSHVFGEIFYNDLLTSAFASDGFDFNLYFFGEVPIYDGQSSTPVSFQLMNRLDLSRVFILTSSGTASASELVIVGLEPYIPVTVIGTSTVGKNVGSITLYDSPESGYTSSDNVNPTHKYAMQPIISQLANSQGFTDYVDGIAPDIEISELDFLGDLQPLGSETEPLLAEALGIISGTGRKTPYPSLQMEKVFESKESRPFLYRGILDPVKIELDFNGIK